MRNRYWIILIITLNLVLTSLVAVTKSTESATPQPVVAKPSNPNAIALLVGINQYKSRSIPGLRGAVNDVENIRNLLVESFNFPNDGSGSRYVLISGSATQEESYELSMGGRTYGALTWYLADQIRRAGANATYRDVMEIVRSRVTAKYPNQRPQLEGANADNFVFSAKSSKSAPYVIVTPMPADEVSLNVGEVHNASVGSVYDVYPPGTREFGEGSAVAQVTLVAVEPTRATAKINKGGSVEVASRAVERTHHYPNPVLNVFIEGAPGSAALQKIKAALSEYKHISVLSAARDYDLLLRETEGYIVTEGGDATEISPRMVAVDSDTVSHVVDQVTGWAKYVNVLNIRNENPKLKVGFEIDSPVALNKLTEGNEISIAIKNESNQNLYLVLLDLSSSGAITVVYGGGEEGIAPGYILHKRLRTTIPSGYESLRDVLKLIVTTEPADFGFIEQPPVTGQVKLTRSRNRSRNPLEELLASATIGTIRGAKMRVETGDWVTIEHAIEIRPNN